MASRRTKLPAGVTVLVTCSLACARYEPGPGYEALARTPPPPECFERPATIASASAALATAAAIAPAVAGVVQDEHGRPVAGAVVDLRGDSTVLARTDSAGRFAFPHVPPGKYGLRVRALGHNILNAEITHADTDSQRYRWSSRCSFSMGRAVPSWS